MKTIFINYHFTSSPMTKKCMSTLKCPENFLRLFLRSVTGQDKINVQLGVLMRVNLLDYDTGYSLIIIAFQSRVCET
jgi:hypothetical protein